jgi:DNA-binding transcriptional ArsR family regulator
MSPAMTLSGARIVLDKLQDNWTSAEEGLTFIPTAFGRPHLLAVHASGRRPVVQYPTATDEPVPLDVVQRRIDAFAHPVRLRLCRTLARGPRTTGELAEAWQLSAPEVSRHLAVLKKAGLTVTTRRGRYVSHQLDLSATAALGADLIAVLLR